MAQRKFDERMEAMDQEVSKLRAEIQKLPGIEETLLSLSKSIEKLGVQAEKQQIMLTTIAVDLARGQKLPVGDESGNHSTSMLPQPPIIDQTHAESSDAAMDRSKFKKVEMPVFSGIDPGGWLFRADRYFHIHRLSETEKMTVAVISFDGVALDWYRAQEERDFFTNWANLKRRLLMRFHSEREGSLCGRFLAIKQETIVEAYRNLFDKLVAVVLGMQWLHTLGVTEVNWRNLTMSFNQDGKIVVLRGDSSLTKLRVSLKSMIRSWTEVDQGFLIECRFMEGGVSLAECHLTGSRRRSSRSQKRHELLFVKTHPSFC